MDIKVTLDDDNFQLYKVTTYVCGSWKKSARVAPEVNLGKLVTYASTKTHTKLLENGTPLAPWNKKKLETKWIYNSDLFPGEVAGEGERGQALVVDDVESRTKVNQKVKHLLQNQDKIASLKFTLLDILSWNKTGFFTKWRNVFGSITYD